jgi:hypothetical protein
MTHTPGPWKAYITTRQVAVSHEGQVVATINHFGDNPADNARLIAAAPDLLEACETVYGMMSINDMPYVLIAAINKAKGQ